MMINPTIRGMNLMGSTHYGIGAGVMPQLVLGAVGYWLMTGVSGVSILIIDDGESTVSHFVL